jgi:hypothetical protein
LVIEQHRIEPLGAEPGERSLSVGDELDVPRRSLRGEGMRDQPRMGLVILHHQNPWRVHIQKRGEL